LPGEGADGRSIFSGRGDAEGEAIAKINSDLTKIVTGVFGARWGLRAGSVLPAALAGLFLYGGFTAHKASDRMQALMIGFFFAAVVLGVLIWSVFGDFD